MEKTTKSGGRDGWTTPEAAFGKDSWKTAPSRESTHDDPASDNARVVAERTMDENAPLADRERGTAASSRSSAWSTLSLVSPSFENGMPMPDVHAAGGGNLSPPLRWSGIPADTKTLALLMEDPDAPDPRAPQRIFTHWIVVDISPSVNALEAGAAHRGLPAGAKHGKNDEGVLGYSGPRPPTGRHRYFFRLFALDIPLPGKAGTYDRNGLLQSVKGHVLGETQVVGTYEQPRNPKS